MLAVSGVVAQCLFHVHHGHLSQRMFPKVPEPTLPALIEHVVEFSLAALHGLRAAPAATIGQDRRPGRRGAAAGLPKAAGKRKSARKVR
jgi:hypothetical protein